MPRIHVTVPQVALGPGIHGSNVTITATAGGQSLGQCVHRRQAQVDTPCTFGATVEIAEGQPLDVNVVVRDSAGVDHPVAWAPAIPEVGSADVHAEGPVTATIHLARLDPPPNHRATVARSGAGDGSSTVSVGAPTETRFARVWGFPTSRLYSAPFRHTALQGILAMGLTDVVFFLNEHPNAWHSSTFEMISPNIHMDSRRAAFVDLCQALRSVQVDVHFMAWPQPTLHFMEDLSTAAIDLCTAVRPRTFTFDAEGPWTSPTTATQRDPDNPHNPWRYVGYSDLHDEDGAMHVVTDTLIPALRAINCQIGSSDCAVRPNGTARRLARACDFTLPQAYSTTQTDGERRPGIMQRAYHENYGPIGKPMVLLVAAWHLRRPESAPEATEFETMQYTVDQIEAMTGPAVDEIGYWWDQGASPDIAQFETEFTNDSRWAFMRDLSYRVRQRVPFAPRRF